MSKEILNTLGALEAERGILREIVIDALEAALVSAYKRHYYQAQNVGVEFDQEKGKIHIYAVKEITEEVMDSQLETSLRDALLIDPVYEIGDTICSGVTPKDFGRIAAQTIEQVILQRIHEAERTTICSKFSAYEKGIVQGVIGRQDKRYIYVNLGKTETALSRQDQMSDESYQLHDRIEVYVSRVENTSKGPQAFISRGYPDLLRHLLGQGVSKVYDGVVEVVSIAREAGDRLKMAVRSNDPNIDTVGTCVGPKGQQVQAIVNELKGENMNIVGRNEDPAVFIVNALDPTQIMDMISDETSPRACTVVVPDYQSPLVIGERGQNARLTVKSTSHKIDIKSESDMTGFYENQEQQKETEELHDEAAAQSDLTDDEYGTITFNNETVEEKSET